MRTAAPYLGLLLIATACSVDEEGYCRCAPGAASFEATPPAPPQQPPATTVGAPFALLDGSVNSANESIRGNFTVRESELGSSVALRTNEPGKVCASGHLDQVPDDAWDSYWGAEVSMTLNEPPGGSPSPWRHDGVTGFAFELSGNLPLDVRMVAFLRDGDQPSEGMRVTTACSARSMTSAMRRENAQARRVNATMVWHATGFPSATRNRAPVLPPPINADRVLYAMWLRVCVSAHVLGA